MKKYLSILFAAAILCGCSGNDPEPYNYKTDVYISGYTIYAMPYKDRYCQVMYRGETINGESLSMETLPMTDKLTYSDLPYSYNLPEPKLLEDFAYMNYYTIYLYCPIQQSELSLSYFYMEEILYASAIKAEKDEYILKSQDGKSKIGIRFKYIKRK